MAVLKSLRITVLTGIMAGSELPHRYVERVTSAQKVRALSGQFQLLIEHLARLTDFPFQQTQEAGSFLGFFLAGLPISLSIADPCNLGSWRGALRECARDRQAPHRSRSLGLGMRLLTCIFHFISTVSP